MCHLVRLCLKPREKGPLLACLCSRRRRMWTIRSTALLLLPGRRRRLVAASAANWAPARSAVPLAAAAAGRPTPPPPFHPRPALLFRHFGLLFFCGRLPRLCVQCASCLPFARVSPSVALAITLRSLPAATGELFRPVTGPSSPRCVRFFPAGGGVRVGASVVCACVCA